MRANYLSLKQKNDKAILAACVKANAYGLGIKAISRALYGFGCRVFFVASAGEGQDLRQHIGETASIYVLNGPASKDIGLYFGANLKPVINSLEQAQLWKQASQSAKHPPFCAIHMDTGMERLGISASELDKIAVFFDAFGVDLVMSHLACASDATHPMNARQLARFRQIATQLPIRPLSLSASAGIFLGPAYHFQMLRPGISLYGGQATNRPEQENTHPIFTLDAPILQIRYLKKGTSIGYDASYITSKDTVIAIVAAGFADGIPRNSSCKTAPHSYGMSGHKRLPIIGQVCMDLTTIDISQAPELKAGHVISFHGADLNRNADKLGTNSHELLARLGQRCRRDYIKNT